MRLLKKLKRRLTPKFWMSVFIIFMFIGSVFGFVMMESSNTNNKFSYNGFKFYKSTNGYTMKYGTEKLDFFYSPKDLENFNISNDVVTKLLDTPALAISFNPNMQRTDVMDLIRFSLFDKYARDNTYVLYGITESNLIYNSLPVLDCHNSSIEGPVLIFEDSNKNEIKYSAETGCIIVSSQDITHRVMFHDKLSYLILNVMER